jgi:anti-sigma-K factor RskA
VNVQDYISSGIVESYVLGLANAREREEFEQMCQQHPEVLMARTEFEISLEQQAMQNAIAPQASMKQMILQAISDGDAKVIEMDQQTPVVKRNWLNYAVAASLVLLAGSLFWNMNQYNRNKKLQASYNELTRYYDSNAVRLAEIEDQVAMLTLNPTAKMAALKGLAPAPASHATVVWDTLTKDVYLVVNNLPQPAQGHQYQLWALFNGKPIDVGMIDNDVFTGEKKLMIQMKNVSGAQAFAITLEKKGGSPTPQGEMYVMGNL